MKLNSKIELLQETHFRFMVYLTVNCSSLALNYRASTVVLRDIRRLTNWLILVVLSLWKLQRAYKAASSFHRFRFFSVKQTFEPNFKVQSMPEIIISTRNITSSESTQSLLKGDLIIVKPSGPGFEHFLDSVQFRTSGKRLL